MRSTRLCCCAAREQLGKAHILVTNANCSSGSCSYHTGKKSITELIEEYGCNPPPRCRECRPAESRTCCVAPAPSDCTLCQPGVQPNCCRAGESPASRMAQAINTRKENCIDLSLPGMNTPVSGTVFSHGAVRFEPNMPTDGFMKTASSCETRHLGTRLGGSYPSGGLTQCIARCDANGDCNTAGVLNERTQRKALVCLS